MQPTAQTDISDRTSDRLIALARLLGQQAAREVYAQCSETMTPTTPQRNGESGDAD